MFFISLFTFDISLIKVFENLSYTIIIQNFVLVLIFLKLLKRYNFKLLQLIKMVK